MVGAKHPRGRKPKTEKGLRGEKIAGNEEREGDGKVTDGVARTEGAESLEEGELEDETPTPDSSSQDRTEDRPAQRVSVAPGAAEGLSDRPIVQSAQPSTSAEPQDHQSSRPSAEDEEKGRTG